MLKIHREQQSAFGEAFAYDRFEQKMLEHCRGYAPRHCEVIGDANVRRVIRTGVERARVYGLTDTGLLRFYVDLMFGFGTMFDTDPLLPWAGEALRGSSGLDQVTRARRLHEAMCAYLDRVNGPGQDVAIRALKRARELRVEGISTSEPGFEDRALEAMRAIHPERCVYLGEERLRDLVRRAGRRAAEHSMATDLGVIVVIGLMFSIGHGFAADPLYPWVGAVLRNRSIVSPERRAERVHTRMQIYLDRAIEYLEG